MMWPEPKTLTLRCVWLAWERKAATIHGGCRTASLGLHGFWRGGSRVFQNTHEKHMFGSRWTVAPCLHMIFTGCALAFEIGASNQSRFSADQRPPSADIHGSLRSPASGIRRRSRSSLRILESLKEKGPSAQYPSFLSLNRGFCPPGMLPCADAHGKGETGGQFRRAENEIW